MPDPEYEERKKQRDAESAATETFMHDHMAAAVAREERGIELLEQIAKQLDSIEHLLRERLGNKQ